MPIRTDVELDTSAALEAITGLGDALTEALTGAMQGFSAVEIDVQVDTDAAESAIGALEAPDLDATLEIDTSAAEAALTDIADQFPDQEFAVAADVSEAIDALGSVAEEAAATEAMVTVTADTSGIAAEVEAAVEGIIPPDVEVGVTADTTGAQEDLDALAQTTGEAAEGAQGATAGMSSLSGAVGGLSATTALAQGKVGGLAEKLKGVAGSAGPVVGGVSAVVATVGLLVSKAEKAVAADERLNIVFGEQAHAIKQIDLGGLVGDIGELAIQAGSGGSAMKQATASLGLATRAAGFTSSQTARLVEQMQALSLRAVALTPSLGEAGDVMEKLTPALSRGGRFAARFGLSLTAAEIGARALADTGKQSTKDLTLLEKAAAGAAISVEQLGGSLGTDFAKGIEQSSVRFKRLQKEINTALVSAGKPLVEPVLEILEGGVPIANAFAHVLGAVGLAAVNVAVPMSKVLLPALDGIAQAMDFVTPILSGVADTLTAIPGPIVALAAAAFLAGPAFNLLAVGLYNVAGAADTAWAAIGPVGLAVAALASVAVATGHGELVTFLGTVAVAAIGASAAFMLLSTSSVTLGGAMSLALGPIGMTIAALAIVAKTLGVFDTAHEDAVKSTEALSEALLGEAEGVAALSDVLTETTASLAEYLRAQLTVGDNADDNADAISRFGFSFRDLADIVSGTDEDFFAFAASVKAGADAVGLHDSRANKFIDSLVEERRALQVVTGLKLEQLVADKQISKEQLAQIKLQNGINEATAGSADATGDYVQALKEAAALGVENNAAMGQNTSAWRILTKAIGAGTVTAEDFQDISLRFGVSQEVIESFATAATEAINAYADSLAGAIPDTTDATSAFVENARTVFGTALDASKGVDDATDRFEEATGKGLDAQRKGVEDSAQKLRDARQKLTDAVAERATAGRTATDQAGVAKDVEAATKQVDDATRAVADAEAGFTDAQHNLADASAAAREELATSQKQLSDAQKELLAATDPQALIDRILAQQKAIVDFHTNVQILIDQGNERAAEEALKLGVDVGSQFAKSLVDSGPDVAASADAALTGVDTATQDLTDDIRNIFVPAFEGIGADGAQALLDNFGIDIGTMEDTTATVLDGVAKVFGEHSPEFAQVAKELAKTSNESWAKNLNLSVPDQEAKAATIVGNVTRRFGREAGAEVAATGTEAILKAASNAELSELAQSVHDQVSEAIDTATAAAGLEATAKFEKTGRDLIVGLAKGVRAGDVAEGQKAAFEALEHAAEAARVASKTHSPSVVFYEIGLDLMTGMAAGVGSGVGSVTSIISGLTATLAADARRTGRAVGGEVGYGILTGLVATLPGIEEAARNLILAARAAAALAAEAKSPSRLFAELGGNIGVGLAQGIRASAGAAAAEAAAAVTAAHAAAAKAEAAAVPPKGPGERSLEGVSAALRGVGNAARAAWGFLDNASPAERVADGFGEVADATRAAWDLLDNASPAERAVDGLGEISSAAQSTWDFLDNASPSQRALDGLDEVRAAVVGVFGKPPTEGFTDAVTTVATTVSGFLHGLSTLPSPAEVFVRAAADVEAAWARITGLVDPKPLVDGPAAAAAGESVGSDLVGGVAAGAARGAAAIGAALRDGVIGAVGTVRTASRAHSPSELFAEIGRDLAAGLAVGVTDASAQVADAAVAAVADARTAAADEAGKAADLSGFIAAAKARADAERAIRQEEGRKMVREKLAIPRVALQVDKKVADVTGITAAANVELKILTATANALAALPSAFEKHGPVHKFFQTGPIGGDNAGQLLNPILRVDKALANVTGVTKIATEQWQALGGAARATWDFLDNASPGKRAADGIGEVTGAFSGFFAGHHTNAEALLGDTGRILDSITHLAEDSSWEKLGNLPGIKQAQKDVGDLNDHFVDLVGQGHIDQARQEYGKLALSLIESGVSAEEVGHQFGPFLDALTASKDEAANLAERIGPLVDALTGLGAEPPKPKNHWTDLFGGGEPRAAAEQVGGDLSAGVASGAARGAAAIGSALRGAVLGAAATVRIAVGAHSPSELFAKIGDDLMAGLTVGVVRGRGDVAAAAAGAVEAAADAAAAVPFVVIPDVDLDQFTVPDLVWTVTADTDGALAALTNVTDEAARPVVVPVEVDTAALSAATAAVGDVAARVTVDAEAVTAGVQPVVVARSADLTVAPSPVVPATILDSDTSDTLMRLAETLDRAVRATRPVEQTFHKEIDPLHAASETMWALTR